MSLIQCWRKHAKIEPGNFGTCAILFKLADGRPTESAASTYLVLEAHLGVRQLILTIQKRVLQRATFSKVAPG